MTLQLTIRPLDLKWASSLCSLMWFAPQRGPVKSVSGLTSRLASSSDFQTTTKRLLCDDRAILDGRWLAWRKWQWRKRRKRWSPFNCANEIAVEYSVCIFFEAADASVCVRKPFLIIHANENVRWDYVHPKITKFRFCSCSRLGIVKLLLLYKNIVPISYLASFL